MGRRNRKQENYWDGDFEADASAENEQEEETTEEEPKGKKSTPAPKAKETKPEDEDEEPVIEITGKKKKKAGKQTKSEPQKPSEEEETNKEETIEITGKKKKKKGSNTDSTNKTESNNKSTSEDKQEKENEDDQSKESQPDSEESKSEDPKTDSAVEITGKKKKKKGAAAEKEAKPAPKKKGGLSAAVAEQIRKQQEEQDKKRKEEEERKKKEEEELQKQLEEEARLEAIRNERKQKKKEKEKIKQQIAQEAEKARKIAAARERIIQSHGIHIAALAETEGEKKKKPVYDNKKKKKPQDSQDLTTSQDSQSSVTTQASEELKLSASQDKEQEQPVQTETETKKEEEEVESWETRDNWEDLEEEKVEAQLKSKEEKPKEQAQKEEPKKETPENGSAEKKPAKKAKKEQAKGKQAKETNQQNAEEEEELRSPICCILGHVDVGKTKLLDKMRHTNVQEGEAGGITQQIGATFFPMENIKEQCSKLSETFNIQFKVPGLLVIDTPGHESFTNLRSRGSGLCDIAVLVVDLMHGLEPQTIESINLLRMRKTPFIVALNKVDRIYGWKESPYEPIQQALAKQERNVTQEYDRLVRETVTGFAEQGLNAQLYYKNKSLKDWRTNVSLVPTSAHEGSGIPDLLALLVQLTQKLMADRLLYLSELQCTILEVKVIEGLGTTIDVILVNGVLNEGDTIVVCGLNGPIVTTIRALLTPQPMKEMRVKGQYVHHKTIKAAQGIKICAQDLDKAVAGSSLLVAGPEDDIEELKEEVMQDLETMRKKVDKSGKGVWVQASTLGSLEALIEFLNQSKIPVSGVNIGPVNKKDVMRASVMLEHAKEYAVILAFDVKVTRDARDLAEEMGVRVFTAEIIYHLFDQFTAYMEEHRKTILTAAAAEAVFPCKLKILPEYIFNKRDPIVIGVEVLEGTLHINTPIVTGIAHEYNELGRVTSIQQNHKPVEKAKKATQVAIKIEQPPGEQLKSYGRHWDENDDLYSRVTRQSIDVLKQNFRDQLEKDDVQLLARLKKMFEKTKWFNPTGAIASNN